MKKIFYFILLVQGGFVIAQTKTLVTMYGEKVQYNPNSPATANNGLTVTSGNIQFGGNLMQATSLTTTSTFTLAVNGLQTTGAATDNFVVTDASTNILKLIKGTSMPFWGLKGNIGTNATTNFLGTTDDVDLIFKRNGIQAGRLGANNTAFGTDAFSGTPNSINNVAIGTEAMKKSGGLGNVGIGYKSLTVNGVSGLYPGNYNTSVGTQSLTSNDTGNSNVAIGTSTMYSNISGNYNTALGAAALQYITNSALNVAVGYTALGAFTAGNCNLSLGSYSGQYVANGSNNIFLGNNSANNSAITTMNNSIIMGYMANAKSNTETNEIVIGYSATGRGSNTVQIGNSSMTDIGGQVAWSNPSDVRLKKDIHDSAFGLNFINKLRPVTYFMKSGTTDLQSGFIAQEVETAATSINYKFSGIVKPQSETDFYSLRYSEFVVPLVKAVQEQQAEIESQNIKINELQEQVRNMKKILEELLKK